MSKEIQKDDVTLPGGLGTVNGGEITKMFKRKDGSTTITIQPVSISLSEQTEGLLGIMDWADKEFAKLHSRVGIKAEDNGIPDRKQLPNNKEGI